MLYRLIQYIVKAYMHICIYAYIYIYIYIYIYRYVIVVVGVLSSHPELYYILISPLLYNEGQLRLIGTDIYKFLIYLLFISYILN